MEKRHNYVRKVAEVATQLFITNDKPNIAGLILAGSADFKTELSQSDMFDPVSIYYVLKSLFKKKKSLEVFTVNCDMICICISDLLSMMIFIVFNKIKIQYSYLFDFQL